MNYYRSLLDDDLVVNIYGVIQKLRGMGSSVNIENKHSITVVFALVSLRFFINAS